MLSKSAMKWLTLAVGCSMLASAGLASEIYRWTDEDGNVHYGDRPTGQADEQRVAIKSKPTDNSAVQQRYDNRLGESEGPRFVAGPDNEEAEEDRRPTRAERKAAQAEREADCEKFRAQLERMEASRRLYREDENGERVWLDDNQILDARNAARERVAETCN